MPVSIEHHFPIIPPFLLGGDSTLFSRWVTCTRGGAASREKERGGGGLWWHDLIFDQIFYLLHNLAQQQDNEVKEEFDDRLWFSFWYDTDSEGEESELSWRVSVVKIDYQRTAATFQNAAKTKLESSLDAQTEFNWPSKLESSLDVQTRIQFGRPNWIQLDVQTKIQFGHPN